MIWWTRSCEKVGVLAERKCGHALNVVLREKNDMMWQGTLSSTSIYPFPAAFVVLSSQDETNSNLTWNINMLCLSNFIIFNSCSDVDTQIQSKMKSIRNEYNELVWNCTECSYSHKKKTNTFRHVEAKHVLCSYYCPLCGAHATCRNSLKQHMILKHAHHG